MRRRHGVGMVGRPLRPLAGTLLAVGLAAVVPHAPAEAQWIEAGPSTSTNTAPSTPGAADSNTLVYGMSGQGDPVYGAANAVLQSPLDPNTYWVATTSGGIWITNDGGKTWTPTTDHQRTLAVGAITVDTSDPTGQTLYAGSGYYSAGPVNAVPPTTLLKSIDGGKTWTQVTSSGIRNLYLDSGGNEQTETNPASIKNIVAMGNVILVAAGDADDAFSYGQAGGLYRSTDGGAHFSLVHGFDTEVTSLISTTINNQTVLIAARNSSNYPTANGVLYSIDGGAHWTPLLDNGTTLQSTNSVNQIAFYGGTPNINVKVAAGSDGSLFVAVVKGNSVENTAVYYTPHFTPGSTPTWYNLGEAQFIAPSGHCAPACTLQGNTQGATHFALIADPTNPGVA